MEGRESSCTSNSKRFPRLHPSPSPYSLPERFSLPSPIIHKKHHPVILYPHPSIPFKSPFILNTHPQNSTQKSPHFHGGMNIIPIFQTNVPLLICCFAILCVAIDSITSHITTSQLKVHCAHTVSICPSTSTLRLNCEYLVMSASKDCTD